MHVVAGETRSANRTKWASGGSAVAVQELPEPAVQSQNVDIKPELSASELVGGAGAGAGATSIHNRAASDAVH